MTPGLASRWHSWCCQTAGTCVRIESGGRWARVRADRFVAVTELLVWIILASRSARREPGYQQSRRRVRLWAGVTNHTSTDLDGLGSTSFSLPTDVSAASTIRVELAVVHTFQACQSTFDDLLPSALTLHRRSAS
jgi:hypothetical protein